MDDTSARAAGVTEEQRAAVRRTALILGAVALAVFVAFMLTGVFGR